MDQINFGSVKCTDIEKVYDLKKPRIEFKNSPANKWFESHSHLKPLGYISDKYGKNHSWSVITAKWDLTEMAIDFKILLNQKEIKVEEIRASKEDICREFGWKDFKIINACSIVADELTFEEKEELIRPAIEATKRRMKKAARLAAKAGESAPEVPEEMPEDFPDDDNIEMSFEGLDAADEEEE